MTDDDDALLELGRMMKDAGKKLWRSFSQSGKHADSARRRGSIEDESSADDSRNSGDQEITPVDEKHRDVMNTPSLLFDGEPTTFTTEDVEIAAALIEFDESVPMDDDGLNDSGFHETTTTPNLSSRTDIENHVNFRALPVS